MKSWNSHREKGNADCWQITKIKILSDISLNIIYARSEEEKYVKDKIQKLRILYSTKKKSCPQIWKRVWVFFFFFRQNLQEIN